MSNISYNEFTNRFEEVCVENRTPVLRTTIHRDKHKNSLCFVIEYQNLDKEKRDGILREFLAAYNPKYFPELLHFTGKKRGSSRTLVLVFEYFKKLSHYLAGGEKKALKTLTFKEVIYVFRRVIKVLYYLHQKGICHGDIREHNVFVNKQNELKLLVFPLMNSNIQEARMQVALKDHYKASGVFLPPELLPYLREANIDNIDQEMMKNNDVFCLALMCIRIINPTIFFNSLKMDEMQVDTERLGTIIDALNPYLNKEFGEILKSCLQLNPSERPRLEVLRDILEFPEIRNMSCHSLMEFEERANKKEERSKGDDSSMFNEFKQFLNSNREEEPEHKATRAVSAKKTEEKRDRAERPDRKEGGKQDALKGKTTSMAGPQKALHITPDQGMNKEELSPPPSPVSKISLSQIVSVSGDENMQEILDQMNNFMDHPKTIGSFNPQEIVHQISNLADLSSSFIPNHHFSKSKQDIFSEPQEQTNDRKADEKKMMSELRFKCIEALEKTVYEKLRETKKFEKSIGETTYKIKLLDDKKKVGFVINPNDDIYFGYLRDLMRDDLGIFFMKRGDVYHGEFRRGKLCGQGVYLFSNGDVLDGEWKDDLLHGTAKLFVAENNSHLICHFSEGNLIQSTKDPSSAVNDINLTEFYQLFFSKTKLVRNLTREYLLDNYRETMGAKSKTPNTGLPKKALPTVLSNSPSSRESASLEKIKRQKANRQLENFNRKENKNFEFYKDYYKELIEDKNLKLLEKALAPRSPQKKSKSREALLQNVEELYSKVKALKDRGGRARQDSGESWGGLLTDPKKPRDYAELPRYRSPEEDTMRLNRGTRTENKVLMRPKHTDIRSKSNQKGGGDSEFANELLLNQIKREGNKLKNVLDELSSDEEWGRRERRAPASRGPSPHPPAMPQIRLGLGDSDKSYELRNTGSLRHQEDANFSGFGQVFFKTGERFYGYFAQGLADGNGCYYDRQGNITQGKWSRGALLQVYNKTRTNIK